MKLKQVHVREFWSVLDAEAFKVEDITCLVGKNEAGKTAILQALYRLNPINEGDGTFNVTDDYPRSTVTEYENAVEKGSRTPAVVVEADFELEDAECRPIIEEFGRDILGKRILTLLKGYENKLHFRLTVDEREAGAALLEKAQLTTDVDQQGIQWRNLKELQGVLDQLATKKAAAYATAQKAADALTDADEKTKALAEAQLLQESAASKTLRAELPKVTSFDKYLIDKYLGSHIPKFLYFDEYYQLRGCENIQALQKRTAEKNLQRSDHPLLGLISLAGLKLADLLNVTRTRELKNKLEGASNHLTRQIIKYWSQNRYLRLDFDVREAKKGDPESMREGTNIWGSVYDSKHFVTTDLGSRSRGFIWFFSFLAWYSQLRDNKGIILLLDEPGLSLHGKAQEDLIRYFEEQLKGVHQLVYTTHSPFMVDSHNFSRVRIVQDRSIETDEELPANEQGTKVIVDVLEATGDSLFPLQGALGYEIYQTLFIGPNSLIVEGASDLLYIQTISGILSKLGKEALSSQWTITPVGGADKVPTFVALIGSQKKLNVATLIDLERSHTQMIENLYKKKLLKKSHVLTFANFTQTAEADVEDMFERDFYLQLVNNEFQNDLAQPVTPAALNLARTRILSALDEHLKVAPLKGAMAFSHYRPARYFTENADTLSKQLSGASLDRFEAAFKALNKLLPQK